MAPLRLSTGRTVSPLRRPKLASARDLELGQSNTYPFPLKRDLHPKMHSPIEPLDARVAAGAPGKAWRSRLMAPVIETLEGPIEEVGLESLPWEMGSLGEPIGLDVTPSLSPTVAGAPGLPSLGLAEEESIWDHPLAPLTPRLEPPILAERPEGATGKLVSDLHITAAQALMAEQALLLADDLGTGKEISVSLAISSLLQQGRYQHVLIVAPESRLRTWAEVLAEWSPGARVLAVVGQRLARRRAWTAGPHILLAGYQTLGSDISDGVVDPAAIGCDILVADSALAAIHLAPHALDALRAFNPARKWALSGGLPREIEDWRSLFGLLIPGQMVISSQDTVALLRERFGAYFLRRTKSDFRPHLPPRIRQEIWLGLTGSQASAYAEALASERSRLSKMGNSVTKTHIDAAMSRLNAGTAFAPGSFDGVKVRALLDLLEGIIPGGGKLVVFSQYGDKALDQLIPTLEAYGVLRLTGTATESERDQILDTFRRDPLRYVLLADLDARADGGQLPASHILHFDVGWNSARRIRTEMRFYPELKPLVPINIYEFWTVGSHDERLHRFLKDRGLLAEDLPSGTQPADLEERIATSDWLKSIFDVDGSSTETPRQLPSTGLLPGTSILRRELSTLGDSELLEALEQLMDALGFSHSQRLETEAGGEADEEPHQDILAWRTTPSGDEQVLARVIRREKNVGVSEGRSLLAALDERPECLGAYLVSTSDFTGACRSLGDESDGRLALVSGVEFYRHLHILGWL